MTDFDKLIKEKAEQAEYAYKPSAWRRFQRTSGLRRASTAYWVAGVSSVIVIGGIVAFVGSRHSQNTVTDNNPPAMTIVDTLTSQPATVEDTFVVTKSDRVVTAATHASEKKQEQEKPETMEEPTPAVISAPKKVTTQRHGRPLVIDVDTIKENVPTDEELRNGNSRLY
jgi:chromosomal replication initiation ATPase DnaA